MGIRVYGIILGMLIGRLYCTDLTDSMKVSVQRGAAFLCGIQREDGAICDSINPLFETWETIAALEALMQAGNDTTDPVFRRAYTWLGTQVQPGGLVCHNRRCKDAWCLETTAELVRLNTLMNRQPDFSIADSLLKWQRHDGSWVIGNPDVQERTDFPSVTAFGLRTLNITSPGPEGKTRAMKWLFLQLHQDSLWGATWEYYGSVSYAAWPAAEALATMRGCRTHAMLKVIRNWLLGQQKGDSHPGGISAELETALMLSTWAPIIGSGSSHCRRQDRLMIQAQVRYLINSQRPDGSWYGGTFPVPVSRYAKQEYLFCTARIVSVFAVLIKDQVL